MGKEIVTNRSAAGLRRSAIAERLRLRQEWSSLKGTEDEPAKVTKKTNVFSKNLHNIKERSHSQKVPLKITFQKDKENAQPRKSSLDPLRGVVALVDIGSENRALALRAALAALGATVVPAWSPLVTHLVWAQGGCRVTRAKARGLACFVVSPLWVEACAASARRVSEKVFPSTARASDLPSPATLCRLLKRAEKENWQLTDLLYDHNGSSDRPARLRISSDTDDNTKNKTADTTHESIDIENRVNTALRRALPASISPAPANPKSRRKLFTAKADETDTDDSDAENTPACVAKAKPRPEVGVFRPRPNRAPTRPEKSPSRPEKLKAPERVRKAKKYNLTQEQKRNLVKAEKIAKKLAAQPAVNKKTQKTQTQRQIISKTPRIVLTGMPKSQYRAVIAAIQSLNGKVQRHVNHKTTHVLLGTCKEDSINVNAEIHPDRQTDKEPSRNNDRLKKNISANLTPSKEISICNQCNDPQDIIIQVMENDNVTVSNHCSQTTAVDKDVTIICSKKGVTSDKQQLSPNYRFIGDQNNIASDNNPFISNNNNDVNCDNNENLNISELCQGIVNDKRLRTLKTLLGAARGCRVLHAQWALDSQREKQWQHHIGYEVTYLLKVAQKAYIERAALGKLHSEYAYDVFRGMQVSVSERADQREAAVKLLSLCGAEIVDHSQNAQGFSNTPQDGRPTQNGGTIGTQLTQYGTVESCGVVRIGKDEDEVCSKWVFDSVAAGRPRTTRRYINRNIPK